MLRLFILAAVITVGLSSCAGSHESSRPVPASAKAAQAHVRHLKSDGRKPSDLLGGIPGFHLEISLVDAPLIGGDGAHAQFNAGIVGVDAVDGNGDSWQLVARETPQVVDLLTLQTSALALGGGSLPAGSYPAVQLLLDPGTTTVTYGGNTYPVQFVDPNHPWWDSTQTVEAVTVPLHVMGDAGQSIAATLDFNVFQSANLTGGVVLLTPTVAGGIGKPAISGTVSNAAGTPVADAMIVATAQDGTVANTTITAADGSFHVRGINPGGYTISVVNAYTTKAGVAMTASAADAGAAPSAYVVVGPDSQVNAGNLND